MEYDKADLDKDGNISKEEFKVWLENRRQYNANQPAGADPDESGEEEGGDEDEESRAEKFANK